MDSVITMLKEKYAPDSRVEIFNIGMVQEKDSIILRGETTSKAAYEELISLAGSISGHVEDNIRLLPGKEPGGAIWGVIYNSVGTLRAEPRYGSELVSQGLLGMPVKILDEHGGWRRIQTPDRYIGWINGSVKAMTEPELRQYLRLPKIIVTSLHARPLEKPEQGASPVSDLVAGNMLEMKGVEGGFYHVAYPDGREAYVAETDALETTAWRESLELTGERIVDTARRFMGIPYLWGGTSSKGLDCSGFTKMVYFMHGIILPRDASQQVRCGKLVDSSGDFSDALPGDLLFFGGNPGDGNPERVVHVGIYTGGKRFIHASDYVHVSSLDPADPLYDEHNANRYLRARRIIGGVDGGEGIEKVFENEFYKL